MNVRHIKAGAWLGSLALGGWLGWTIYGFVQEREALQKGSDPEFKKATLDGVEAPPPPEDNTIDYNVVTQAFQQMNWPGRPPAIVAEVDEGQEEPEAKYKPVAELLQVQYLQVDRSGDRSLAWVKFLDPELVAAATRSEDKILGTGDALADPYGGISVKEITPEGVVFAFAMETGDEAEERGDELVALSTFEGSSSIVVVGADGVIEPQTDSEIPRAAPITFNPRETTQVRKNEYLIGSDTAVDLEENYSEILTRDLSYQAYRDPSTRKITGIEITKVKPGSLPEQHGLQEGEVLKKINDHVVTSVSDATNYVKKNADNYDVWIATFERRGREYTRTYRSPPE